MQLLTQLPGAIRETLECLSGDTCSPAVKGIRGPVRPVSALTAQSWCFGSFGASQIALGKSEISPKVGFYSELQAKYKYLQMGFGSHLSSVSRDLIGFRKSGVQGATWVMKCAYLLRVRGTSKTSLILFCESHWQ